MSQVLGLSKNLKIFQKFKNLNLNLSPMELFWTAKKKITKYVQ